MKTLSLIILTLCSLAGAQVKIDLPFDIRCREAKWDTYTVQSVTVLPPFGIRVSSKEGCAVTYCLASAPDSVTVDGKKHYKPKCDGTLSNSASQAAASLYNEVLGKLPETLVGKKAD